MLSESLSEDSSEKMVTDGVNIVSVLMGGVADRAGGTTGFRQAVEGWIVNKWGQKLGEHITKDRSLPWASCKVLIILFLLS